MNNKRNWIVGIVLVLLVVAVVLIRPASTEKVKIGAILPLAGSLAYTGEEAKTALAIAVDDYPKTNISLVIENDSFTPKVSISAFNKLSQVDNVVAVIGPLNGSAIESVRTLANQSKVTVFTPYGGGNDIGEYLYKDSVEAIDEATAMANKAKELGYNKLAIMYLQTDMGYRYLKIFKEVVSENGGTLVAEEGNPVGASDFRTALLKIKEAKPDAVYVVDSSAPTGQIIKQAAELNIRTNFLSVYATESPEILRIAGKNLEGLIYTSIINASSLTDKQERFITEYKKRTGSDPQIVAYNVYDIYSILVQAVDKCQSNKECINNYVKNVKDYDGVSGKFSIVNGKLVRDFYFKQVKDGQFVALD